MGTEEGEDVKRLLVLTLMLATLATPALAEDGKERRYVEFLDRRVPVAQLEQRVYVTDASFRDYGAVRARKEFALKGAGVEVCIVDTGVDPRHEQLDDGKVVAFADFVPRKNGSIPGELPVEEAYDDHGHGTHVASIVAGDGKPTKRYRGVAPKAHISAAKVLNSSGSGSFESVIMGIEWCAARADVLNLSLSSNTPSDGSDVLSAAVNHAVDLGVVVVVAAGNMGPIPGSMGSPAAAVGALTVGASSEWSGGDRPERSFGPYLAPFSSRGPTIGGALKPDVVGPGVTVMAAAVASYATPSGYRALSGTSMSTPYVAGTVALMLQGDPTIAPDQVKDLLHATALDLGKPGPDGDYGYGYVNSYSAVAAVLGRPGADIFPPHRTLVGTGINDQGGWFYPATGKSTEFIPIDPNQPIAATLIFDPVPVDQCIVACPEWPNWNAALRAPAESYQALDTSMCSNLAPNVGWCGTGASGRQETLAALPSQSPRVVLGYSHFIVVFADAISSPPERRDATFTIDLFYR